MDDSPSSLREITSLWVLGGVWSQGWNLKELTEGHTRSGACGLIWLNTGKLTRSRHSEDWQIWELFLDSMGGGAWPFVVGGVICLVNSVNERDLNLLNSDRKTSIKTRGWLGWSFDGSWPICVWMTSRERFLEGLFVLKQMEVWGNNRSVMPLDVLGRTRATLISSTSLTPCSIGPGNLWKTYRDGARSL